jgi:hypothetical protein
MRPNAAARKIIGHANRACVLSVVSATNAGGDDMTTRKHRSLCVFPECVERKDKDRKSGLCEDHTASWLQSKEWREATRDESVRFFMNLKMEKQAMRFVSKYRRQWAKRVSEEEGT